MTDRTHPDSGRITNPGAAYANLPDIDEEDGLIWQAIFDWKDCEPGAPALAAADRLSCLLADQMRAFADATHALRVAPHGQAPAPTHFGDEAHVVIPQMLLGAACSAIDKKRDGTKVLAELRRLHADVEHKDKYAEQLGRELATADDRAAFKAYLEDCDECAIVPDIAGAFHAGWTSRVRAAQPAGAQQPGAARHAAQAAPAAVAYLDIGTGGYLDLGTDLANEALSRLPKGRHALVIAGTYGIDGYTAAPTTQPAPQQEPSHTAVQLAELVLSDCGHSSNYTPLLDRVAARIDAHVERRLDELRGCLESKPAPQPSPAAQGDALDAARLDWLDKQIKSQDLYAGFIWQADGGYEGNMGLVGKVKTKGKMTARQAIDAARAAQEDKSHDHI